MMDKQLSHTAYSGAGACSLVGESAESLCQEELSLTRQIIALRQEVLDLQQQVTDLQDEKADLEMMLKMTTEHSDNMEEELYKKVEFTLRESEKWFRLITETMPIPVIITHAEDGTILYVNTPARQLVGAPDTEPILGQNNVNFYIHLEDQNNISAILQREGQVSNYEMQGKRLDGTPFWVELSVQPLTFNDAPCLLNTLYDVTERKRAEQERTRLAINLEFSLEQQTNLTKAYSRFVPSEILAFLGKESIIDVQLGESTQQQMTVLFSDIRSFTAMSEQMSPEENFRFINSYLKRVSPIIRNNKGFIDKYIGDAIMALFPGDIPGQADDALHAAVQMQWEVNRYNQQRIAQGEQPISIGIGLHTGSVMLGTVGEMERMEGTVISDAVNLASRLEGLTKMYGVSIIVSERTLFSLARVLQYHYRFLDKVKVKGKKEPVAIFEIFDGDSEESIALKIRTQDHFERGLMHYLSAEFTEAITYFKRVLAVNPTDRAAEIYIQRADYYVTYGIPLAWEGIESLTEK